MNNNLLPYKNTLCEGLLCPSHTFTRGKKYYNDAKPRRQEDAAGGTRPLAPPPVLSCWEGQVGAARGRGVVGRGKYSVWSESPLAKVRIMALNSRLVEKKDHLQKPTAVDLKSDLG